MPRNRTQSPSGAARSPSRSNQQSRRLLALRLWSLDQARKHVVVAAEAIDEAIKDYMASQLAGSQPSADDVDVIHAAVRLLEQAVPRIARNTSDIPAPTGTVNASPEQDQPGIDSAGEDGDVNMDMSDEEESSDSDILSLAGIPESATLEDEVPSSDEDDPIPHDFDLSNTNEPIRERDEINGVSSEADEASGEDDAQYAQETQDTQDAQDVHMISSDSEEYEPYMSSSDDSDESQVRVDQIAVRRSMAQAAAAANAEALRHQGYRQQPQQQPQQQQQQQQQQQRQTAAPARDQANSVVPIRIQIQSAQHQNRPGQPLVVGDFGSTCTSSQNQLPIQNEQQQQQQHQQRQCAAAARGQAHFVDLVRDQQGRPQLAQQQLPPGQPLVVNSSGGTSTLNEASSSAPVQSYWERIMYHHEQQMQRLYPFISDSPCYCQVCHRFQQQHQRYVEEVWGHPVNQQQYTGYQPHGGYQQRYQEWPSQQHHHHHQQQQQQQQPLNPPQELQLPPINRPQGFQLPHLNPPQGLQQQPANNPYPQPSQDVGQNTDDASRSQRRQ
ncbi:hypothetical protein J7T55_014759 [Diaporthe amygdali]|uniref:uncharacterized protein n=1 Tax=Phomopsis amygdali TaxID=1214568 RepID=UPI0022FE796E|nr:uncharacterized protein J7T55_014759 [Diaporthe amygdali]KAJ0109957.1 hypothetical protein J7T55_014759 [Diaporthe amygdali]